jgi:hypothetical protein
MRRKVTSPIRVGVSYTTRTDGNGKPLPGWYATTCGIPVGPPHATPELAAATAREFVRDTHRCLASV